MTFWIRTEGRWRWRYNAHPFATASGGRLSPGEDLVHIVQQAVGLGAVVGGTENLASTGLQSRTIWRMAISSTQLRTSPVREVMNMY